MVMWDRGDCSTWLAVRRYDKATHGEPRDESPREEAPPSRVPVYTPLVRSHDWIDRRSLALHEAVAAKLEANPELLQLACANLRRWLSTSPAPALREWQEVLDRTPLPQLLALLRSPTDTAARLRQSSPFAGVLTPEERQAVLRRYDPRRT